MATRVRRLLAALCVMASAREEAALHGDVWRDMFASRIRATRRVVRSGLDNATFGKCATGNTTERWPRGQLLEDAAIFFGLDDTLFQYHGSMHLHEAIATETFLVKRVGYTPNQILHFRKIHSTAGITMWGALMELDFLTPALFSEFKLALEEGIPYGKLLSKDPLLRRVLEATPRPRYILTNNFHFHAERVLDGLGVKDLFDGIIALDDVNLPSMASNTDLIYKPSPEYFKQALVQAGVSRGLMVDDRFCNCQGARDAGLAAVQMAAFLPKEGKEGMPRVDSAVQEGSPFPAVFKIKALPAAIQEASAVTSAGTLAILAARSSESFGGISNRSVEQVVLFTGSGFVLFALIFRRQVLHRGSTRGRQDHLLQAA